jgi:peptidoglycan/xylan/chitin deacetylase (PgdA/CDA1 family)
MSKTKIIILLALLVPAAALGVFTFESKNQQSIHWSRHLPRLLPMAADRVFSRPLESTGVRVPVLMYHYIRNLEDPGKDPEGYALSISPEYFEQQIKYLSDEGYQSVTPEDLYQAIENKTKLPPKPVLLTFDDGYEDFYTNAFPILKMYNFKATIFVITGFVSEPDGRYLTWDQIKELDRSGLITIGSHTISHKNLVTRPEILPEIKQSKDVLEKFLGHSVTTFAYPGGAFNENVANLVNQAGYNTAFTTRYGIWHNYDSRFETSRVRISGSLVMEKFIERIQGRLKIF